MTDNNHPITPPLELVRQWDNDWHRSKIKYDSLSIFVATQAARWGADTELEACYAWVTNELKLPGSAICLREDRRPKPPSLKEQALVALNEIEDKMFGPTVGEKLIRRALESLPD